MPFKKGDPKPPGSGMVKGGKARSGLLVREILENKGFNLVDEILGRLSELSKEEQVNALIKLMPYVYPKLTNVELSGNVDVKQRLLEEASNEDLNAILAEAKKI
jgi:hypothetical protein